MCSWQTSVSVSEKACKKQLPEHGPDHCCSPTIWEQMLSIQVLASFQKTVSLSANARKNGIVFIGPEADVIDKMGNKSHARKTMMDAGVPVVPGTKEPVFMTLRRQTAGSRHWISGYDQSPPAAAAKECAWQIQRMNLSFSLIWHRENQPMLSGMIPCTLNVL